jgi:RimJ/RimL family protein N-acetyltransferase
MIYELKRDEFHKVSDFFRTKEIARSRYFLENNKKVKAYVDNPECPKTVAFQCEGGVFLDGDYTNESFLSSVIPEVNKDIAKISFMSEWNLVSGKNYDTLIKLLNEPMEFEKLHYEMTELKFDWRKAVIPEGYELRELTKELLEDEAVKNKEPIIKSFQYYFNGSLEEYSEKSGGFCILKGDEIVSYATFVNYIENKYYGLGIIETVPEYQKKGFGSIVAAATSELCLSKGGIMNWETHSYNIASQKLAEKIGHKLVIKTKTLFSYFDRFISCEENFLLHKNVTKDYDRALKLLKEMYSLRIDDPDFLWKGDERYGFQNYSYCKHYYNLAQVYELSGKPETAIENLNKANECGKNHPVQLEHLNLGCDDPIKFFEEKIEALKSGIK